jgi:hypothetical protein
MIKFSSFLLTSLSLRVGLKIIIGSDLIMTLAKNIIWMEKTKLELYSSSLERLEYYSLQSNIEIYISL